MFLIGHLRNHVISVDLFQIYFRNLNHDFLGKKYFLDCKWENHISLISAVNWKWVFIKDNVPTNVMCARKHSSTNTILRNIKDCIRVKNLSRWVSFLCLAWFFFLKYREYFNIIKYPYFLLEIWLKTVFWFSKAS